MQYDSIMFHNIFPTTPYFDHSLIYFGQWPIFQRLFCANTFCFLHVQKRRKHLSLGLKMDMTWFQRIRYHGEACANAADYAAAEEWYEFMLEKGLVPNKETYGKLSDAVTWRDLDGTVVRRDKKTAYNILQQQI